MPKGRWSSRATPGATFAVRVTPGARRDSLTLDPDGKLHCATTAAPEHGRATAAVTAHLARALGVAKTRVTLLHGATSRDKVFRLD